MKKLAMVDIYFHKPSRNPYKITFLKWVFDYKRGKYFSFVRFFGLQISWMPDSDGK